jgi:hypothetical protein
VGSVIAFGIWVEDEARYASVLRPSLAAVAEPDSVVLESTTDGCVFEAYEEIIGAAATMPGLEALVLVRDDVELRDPELLRKLRAAFATDPSVALVGAAGARHVTSLRWREGEVAAPGEDAHLLDAALVALSPAAVRALRLDRGFWSGPHGAEAELCWLARVAGGRVVVSDLELARTRPAVEDGLFLRADLMWRARWSFAA